MVVLIQKGTPANPAAAGLTGVRSRDTLHRAYSREVLILSPLSTKRK